MSPNILVPGESYSARHENYLNGPNSFHLRLQHFSDALGKHFGSTLLPEMNEIEFGQISFRWLVIRIPLGTQDA